MHSAWVEDIRLRVKCIELSLSLSLSLSLHHLSFLQDTCSIPRTYAVMGGGAISFSFHRRCGIYVLLIHSDIFFYASNDRSMLIPFSSKTEVAGRWRTQGLGGKYNLEPRGGSVEIFPANRRLRPWGSPSPVLPLREKRNSIRRLRIKWSGWMKKQKCKAYKSKVKR